METYVARGQHRPRPSKLSLQVEPADFARVRRWEPSSRETDPRASPRVCVAVIVLSSLGLWALIWFAISSLISYWP
jgi:hypothetical protein